MAGLISPAAREQIRAASDIVEIIGGYLPLKRAGANFVALCPFHKEKTPSFHVNPHRQIFHCFGCHKGGDVFTFLKEYENIGFTDAVRRLAERARIPLEFESEPGQQQARHIKDTLLQIHEQITQRWQAALANDAAGQIARDYLARRGVPDDAIKSFRLGYAPDLWDDTVNWAKSKSYDLALVEKSGLILHKESSDHFYDRFRGRLIFPICDEQGRVVGFSGRVLSGDEKTAKYVNSPETAIFTKGKIIYGLDKSKRALLDTHTAVICEGQLDLIACFMAGVTNIVAPQGTALTTDHARILKRYVDEVVLCFDSDHAGQNAAVRSLDSLLAVGLAIRVAAMPAPHDPDSFIKERGPEAFRNIIDQAGGFFDYLLNRLCELNDAKTDKGRAAILVGMSQALHKTGNEVMLDAYAQKTALRLEVSADAVRAEFRKTSRTPAFAADEPESDPVVENVARPSRHEIWLLKLLLQNDDFVGWIAAHLELKWIPTPLARSIISQRLGAHANGSWSGIAAWLGELDDALARSLVTELLADNAPMTEPEKILKGTPGKPGLLEILRDKFIERELGALQQRLAQPGLTESDQLALLQERQRLRELKQKPPFERG